MKVWQTPKLYRLATNKTSDVGYHATTPSSIEIIPVVDGIDLSEQTTGSSIRTKKKKKRSSSGVASLYSFS